MSQTKGLTGIKGFSLMWLGQLLSLIGTSMTGFALTIWAWLATGQATALALVGFFSFAPTILFSPIAGALVDRWDRKKVLILSDLSSGMATATILILYSTGSLAIWHLYVVAAISGLFQALQWPAYSAVITTLVPKEHYGRAQGMVSVAEAGSIIVAPILAAALLIPIGISGIMCIDLLTMALAIFTLLPIAIPLVVKEAKEGDKKPSLWSEIKYGFSYITERKGLFYLLLLFLSMNLVTSIGNPLYAPFILSKTGNDSMALGTVMSFLGIGGVVGGVVMAVWGGPKRKVMGIYVVMVVDGVLMMAFALSSSLLAWCFFGFFLMMVSPMLMTCSQAIWQSKVAPEVQGRVFSTRRMIAQLATPVSLLISGPLADKVFEPAMAEGGSLSSQFGSLFGVGPGAGMAMIIFIVSVISIAIAFVGYAVKPIRNLERDIPDHDAGKKETPVPSVSTEVPSDIPAKRTPRESRTLALSVAPVAAAQSDVGSVAAETSMVLPD